MQFSVNHPVLYILAGLIVAVVLGGILGSLLKIEMRLDQMGERLQKRFAQGGSRLGEGFVTHGSIAQLYRHCGIDADSVAKRILEVIRHEN